MRLWIIYEKNMFGEEVVVRGLFYQTEENVIKAVAQIKLSGLITYNPKLTRYQEIDIETEYLLFGLLDYAHSLTDWRNAVIHLIDKKDTKVIFGKCAKIDYNE